MKRAGSASAQDPAGRDRLNPAVAFLLDRRLLGRIVRGVARVPASVHTKLLAAFLLITLLFITMAAVSLRSIAQTTEQSRWLDEAHQRVEQSQQIEHALARQMHFTALALLLREEGTVARILRENNRFNNTLAQLEGAATPTVTVPNRDELGALAERMNRMSQELQRLVTAQQQAAGVLRGLNERLEQASRAKSEFLANMSHELRTPMNAILGFTEMLLDGLYGELSPELREPLADIQTNGRHLLRLINEVLDLSKIEAGRMELVLDVYAVGEVVDSVRASLRSLAAEKGLEFVTRVPADLPLAYGDGRRITQCLMNLAGNALKFTRTGRVQIRVDLEGDTLVYRVSDTGIGIPPDELENVFRE